MLIIDVRFLCISEVNWQANSEDMQSVDSLNYVTTWTTWLIHWSKSVRRRRLRRKEVGEERSRAS